MLAGIRRYDSDAQMPNAGLKQQYKCVDLRKCQPRVALDQPLQGPALPIRHQGN
jgi:hypothetical protein